MKEFPQRLVFVEDQASVRKLVREALELAGLDIAFVTCSSGEELLNRLRELQPELILLDLKMPKMSGPDILDALRKSPDGIRVPVLFMTGTKVEMTDHYRALGVIGVLHKPFDIEKLPEQIGELWREHLVAIGKLAPASNSEAH
jgi:CheY-like chemotaxis protein